MNDSIRRFRGFALFAAGCAVGLVGEARSAIWLDGHRLLRQGPLWNVAVDLRTATFAMTVMSWRYTDRLLPVSIKTPALVVQASRFRRIKLPMVCRFAERGSDGRFAARWLPDDERNAIADAIEAYATVPGKEKVAHFLRRVDRSPVQPSVDLG